MRGGARGALTRLVGQEEFRKHRDADQSYQGPFFKAWEEYAETIETQRDGNVGRELPKEKVLHHDESS